MPSAHPLPDANFVATVQHGLPEELLTPRNVEPRYLAFLGRICPEKRPDRAIRIAREAGIPLKIAAKVDRVDEEYFRDTIRPMIDGHDVELIGEIDDAEKPDFLSGAIALLVPIDWPEPFGLVMIEAMACGTPVIAFNRGSVPEIVEHGVTGLDRRGRGGGGGGDPAVPSPVARRGAPAFRTGGSPRAYGRGLPGAVSPPGRPGTPGAAYRAVGSGMSRGSAKQSSSVTNVWDCLAAASAMTGAESSASRTADPTSSTGGPGGNRTHIRGFAVRCITTLPPDRPEGRTRISASPGLPVKPAARPLGAAAAPL